MGEQDRWVCVLLQMQRNLKLKAERVSDQVLGSLNVCFSTDVCGR